MIDTFQVATQGIGPGWTTFNMATLGFDFEIIIVPPPSSGVSTGSGKLAPYIDLDHVIIVRIRKDGNVWEDEYRTSKYFADKIPTVIVAFKSVRQLMSNVTINIKQLGINIKSIFVKGKKL